MPMRAPHQYNSLALPGRGSGESSIPPISKPEHFLEMTIRRPPGYKQPFAAADSATAVIDRPAKGAHADVGLQLAKLTAQLDSLKVQVRQAQQLSTLGIAAATIAHEVNNLLTPMLAYTDTALASNDVELMRKALTVVANNARILVNMSSRVLEIGAPKPMKKEPVKVRAAVDAALAGLCRDLSKDGIRVMIDVNDSIVAECDPLHLQQVLFNLFLNAREAMVASHGGLLKISARVEQYLASDEDLSRVMIEVRNTGEAIPSDLLSHIFEPFQSGKPAIREGKTRCGGLGLALCRDLIEENGGRISVSSDVERGTAFVIHLPIHTISDGHA